MVACLYHQNGRVAYWGEAPKLLFSDGGITKKSREESMDSKEFSRFRKRLNKTQKQMAQLLGVSIKAVHSYEQGWRSVPAHVERQMFFFDFQDERERQSTQVVLGNQ